MKQLLKKLVRKANEKANPEDYRIPMPIKFHEPRQREVKTVHVRDLFPSWVIDKDEELIKDNLLREIAPHLKEVVRFKIEDGFINNYKRITASVDVLEKKEADL